MDAKSFSTYLKETLKKEAQKYEGALLSANYDTLTEAKRMGGIHDTLIGICNSIDKVLEDFYAQGGHHTIIETSSNA